MVKPAGTGTPRRVISARFAPFPPSRFFFEASPSARPPPKKYTRRFARLVRALPRFAGVLRAGFAKILASLRAPGGSKVGVGEVDVGLEARRRVRRGGSV